MNDIVKVKLIGQSVHEISPKEAKAIGMDVEPEIETVDKYKLEYAVYEPEKYEDGLRVEVQAYWDELGGYYFHDAQVHGDYDPGDDVLVKELIEGIFIREYDHEIWCELPITMSLDTMQRAAD